MDDREPGRRKVNPGTCKRCGEPVPRAKNGYYKTQCRRCIHLRMFKMTKEDFEELLQSQGGGCAICGNTEPFPGRSLDIDHDRSCCNSRGSCGNCVRGVLCSGCNTALGLLGDDVERLEAAIGYLRNYEQSN